MGFRFHRRINIGGGLGLNFSNSGVSPSLRTPFGSISTRGLSLRTGIPGLSFRKSGKKGSNFLETLIAIISLWLLIQLFWISLRVAWIVLLFVLSVLMWLALTLYDFIRYIFSKKQQETTPEQALNPVLSAQDAELYAAFNDFHTSLWDLSAQIAAPEHWEGFKIDTDTRPWDQSIRMAIREELFEIGRFVIHDGPMHGSGIKEPGLLMLINKFGSMEEKVFFDPALLHTVLNNVDHKDAFRAQWSNLMAAMQNNSEDAHIINLTLVSAMRKVNHKLTDSYLTHLNRLGFLLLQEDGAVPAAQKHKFMDIRKAIYGAENSGEK